MAKRTDAAAKLEKDITAYFSGISRLVPVQERVPTGQKDENGHEIYRLQSVKNRLGKVVKTEDWLLPPSVPDLLHSLSLTPEDWARMKSEPELGEICEAAERRVERYLRRELLTRPNKAVKGVLLTLQKDFGFGEVSASGEDAGGLEELLGGGGE